ncbi:aldo/keto reductase [Mariniflexile soesokkakense]|uniref:Aldo/keto reductase n=1 Tax=Mariniflexile soesokkakense TaxID=1343160 RepID=A0ABV0ADA4_9FLAO
MINNINDKTILNNGVKMPWLGFGVYLIEDGAAVNNAVRKALETGYRSIDTAAVYKNEIGVGKAINESGIAREDIFLTTKVWNDNLRKKRVSEAFEESLKKLNTDYVDLYLIHWPVNNFYLDAWNEMEKIYKSGRAKAIGVSNFMIPHLQNILNVCEVKPAVNQIEFHPLLVQPELLKFCKEQHIQLEAWSPLIQGQVTEINAISELAKKYGKSAAQIVLRWNLQHGVVTIPKSSKPDRIVENSELFDFELSNLDMELLNSLNEGKRIGPDPYNFDF